MLFELFGLTQGAEALSKKPLQVRAHST
jgi:hypothetical protein